MKRSLRLVLCSFAVVAMLASGARAAQPGSVDFGRFTPAKSGEFVEINLGRGLIKFASFFARHNDPAAADLMASISHVRVNVVGVDATNRAATAERLALVRAGLASEGWEQIVAVRGKKHEDVAIFLKHRDGETVEGIVVTVMDEGKNEAVFINVVGNIRPEQMGLVGERLNLKRLALH